MQTQQAQFLGYLKRAPVAALFSITLPTEAQRPPRAEATHCQKPFEEGVRLCLSAIFNVHSKVLKSGVVLRVNLPVATSNRFARPVLNLRPFASPNPNSLFRSELQP